MNQSRRPWWREPLVHFVSIGGAVFFAHHLLFGSLTSETLSADDAPLEQIRQDWLTTKGTLPSPAQETGLVQEWIDDEVLYRRAIELGLDRNDTIVRRRLVQRMRFLLEDTYRIDPPTDAQLQAWLDDHPQAFALPVTITFTHVFFSRAKHGTDLQTVANAALRTLSQDAGATVDGDPYFRGKTFTAATPSELRRAFGNGFTEAVAKLPVGSWTGPVASSYGLHLLRISARTATQIPELKDVRDKVEQDLLKSERARRNKEAVTKLRARYSPKMPR